MKDTCMNQMTTNITLLSHFWKYFNLKWLFNSIKSVHLRFSQVCQSNHFSTLTIDIYWVWSVQWSWQFRVLWRVWNESETIEVKTKLLLDVSGDVHKWLIITQMTGGSGTVGSWDILGLCQMNINGSNTDETTKPHPKTNLLWLFITLFLTFIQLKRQKLDYKHHKPS